MSLNGITFGNSIQTTSQVKANNRNAVGFGNTKTGAKNIAQMVQNALEKRIINPMSTTEIEAAAKQMQARHDFPCDLFIA